MAHDALAGLLSLAKTQVGNRDLAAAEGTARLAMRIAPGDPAAHTLLGVALFRQARFDEALAEYEAAIAIDANYAEARAARAILWLLHGDYARGLVEFEWRWQTGRVTRPPYRQPLWDGSRLDGRTILLHGEQGLGDTLQFVRLARWVQEQGGRVLFGCKTALHGVLKSFPWADRILAQVTGADKFDCWAPLMSLPRLAGMTLETIPATIDYASADAKLVEAWQPELAKLPGLRVGICWHGKPHPDKLIPLREFRPLAQAGVQLVSLQKGPGVEQLEDIARQFKVIDWTERIDTTAGPLMDTAAIVSQLDLVITTDTMLAHLAGVLGVPVWVALPHVPDWRWLLARSDSPWYPTMRLFRQSKPGDWRSVFAEMAEEMKNVKRAKE